MNNWEQRQNDFQKSIQKYIGKEKEKSTEASGYCRKRRFIQLSKIFMHPVKMQKKYRSTIMLQIYIMIIRSLKFRMVILVNCGISFCLFCRNIRLLLFIPCLIANGRSGSIRIQENLPSRTEHPPLALPFAGSKNCTGSKLF